jgi:hypothetical protein
MTDLPTVGIVLLLHAKCCLMADSKFILMHGNCSHALLEDVWAVLGHNFLAPCGLWLLTILEQRTPWSVGMYLKKGGEINVPIINNQVTNYIIEVCCTSNDDNEWPGSTGKIL